MADKIYVTNGCSNHCKDEREQNDFYATNPKIVEKLFTECKIDFSKNILEPCAGNGHIAKVFKDRGYNVTCADLIQREYPLDKTWNFLEQQETFDGDIVTNPPYELAQECVEKALEMIPKGRKVVMYLKLTFLEGKKRRKLFDTNQLKNVYVLTQRSNCAKNGDEELFGAGAVAYAWFEWEKGANCKPLITWINGEEKSEKWSFME